MRLIDADALIEEIDNQMKELQKDGNDDLARGVTLFIAEKMKSFIKAQPTAYDVEKVVEELSCNSRFIEDINEHNIKCISCVIGQKTAIDIVKKGGAV